MKYIPLTLTLIFILFFGIFISMHLVTIVELNSNDEFNIFTITGIIYFIHFYPLISTFVLFLPIIILIILKILKIKIFLFKTTIVAFIILLIMLEKFSMYLSPF